MVGPPSHVLVVGTPHLSRMPAHFRLHYLARLLDRLVAFKPDIIIAVESLDGRQCRELGADPHRYPGVAAKILLGFEAGPRIAVDVVGRGAERPGKNAE